MTRGLKLLVANTLSLNRGYGLWPDITSGDALSVGHFGKIGHDPWPKNKLGGIKLSFQIFGKFGHDPWPKNTIFVPKIKLFDTGDNIAILHILLENQASEYPGKGWGLYTNQWTGTFGGLAFLCRTMHDM